MAALALLFIAFYALWLGSYPLFTPDEGRYSEVAREMLSTGDFITPRVNGIAFLDKPVLYYWLQAAAMKLFGVNEWAIRFFPALTGVLGCLITYLCSRVLFGRLAAILSAIILATSPLYFGTSHYADLNLEVGVFISASLMLFLTGAKSEGKQRSIFLYAAYLAAALAALTKGLIGLVFPSMIAGIWILLLWRWQLLRKVHLISGFLLFAVLVMPWYLLVEKANPSFLHYFFVTQQVTRFLSGATFNNPTPWWFYLPVIGIGFFPWTIFAVQAIFSAGKAVVTKQPNFDSKLYLLLWAGIIFLFFSIPQSKTIGYIIPVFPALAMLTGSFLAEHWHSPQSKSICFSLINFLLISVIIAGVLIVLQHKHWINFAPPFNWYLSVIAIIFITSAIISVLAFNQKNLLSYFVITTCCSVAFLLTLTAGASHLNPNSSKPIALYLNTIKQPQDEIVNYYNFYQDAPIYLNQTIKIVANWQDPNIINRDNWQRELWLGMNLQPSRPFLIDETQFWADWKSKKRIYVMMDEKYLPGFSAKSDHYYLLKKYNDILLISNQS